MRLVMRGNIYAEYGLVLALVLLVAVVSLNLLGVSVSDLLSMEPSGSGNLYNVTLGQRMSKVPSVNGTVPDQGPASVLSNGSGTAMTQYKTTDGVTRSTNATSVEGTVEQNKIGSLILANALDKLAESEPDDASAKWMRDMAKYSYLLGATEGVQENFWVTTITKAGKDEGYTWDNAMRDMVKYQAELQRLMKSPPPSASGETVKAALRLANDTNNIATKYLNDNRDILENPQQYADKGQVAQDFEQLVDYETLRSDSKRLVAGKAIPVKETRESLTNGVQLDRDDSRGPH